MGAEMESEHILGTIRACRVADAAAVGAIAQDASGLANWTEENYRDSLSWLGIVALVCEEGEGVTGFVFGRQTVDQGEIFNLAVRAAARSRGEGGALLKAAMEEFRARGVSRVFLDVRESNETAIAFYAKQGFSKTGRRPGYYRDPAEAAVLMERKLTG